MAGSTGEFTVKKSLGIRTIRVIAYLVLVLLSLLCLVWFYLLFINATRSHSQIYGGPSLVPSNHLLDNWKSLSNSTLNFGRGIINSAIIAFSTAFLSVYFSLMTAYAIHAYRFKGRNAIHVFILAIMMIPTQVTSLGFYRLIVDVLDMQDNYIPLIVPSIAAPITYFYIVQYMKSNLPMSLIEAARIDGAHEIGILNRIVLPLMRSALSVQLIFAFVASWNNYYMPAMLIQKTEKRTLPILIYSLRAAAEKDKDFGFQYIAMALAVLPVIAVYVFFARSIVGGVSVGGVKE
ncbi:MAG: carbohydrate ABC transporter permease [Lachnospiraceae bacterium]|nr:carbohydrate ABC transporter permease [Lachnospiraceae bacterium]